MFRLEMLPAGCGDCLWIEYGEPRETRVVLIDGGIKDTATELTNRIRSSMAERHVSELRINLLIITHFDNDHIDGILELLKATDLPVTFGDIWFNGAQQLAQLPPAGASPDGLGDSAAADDVGGDNQLPADLLGAGANAWSLPDLLGASEGEEVSQILKDRHLPWNKSFEGRAIMIPQAGKMLERELPGGLRLTLLGPTLGRLRRLAATWQKALGAFAQDVSPVPATPPDDLLGRRDTWPPKWIEAESKDGSPANGSSIALLAEYRGKVLLLTGDGYASDLVSAIDRVQAQRGKAGERLPLHAFKLSHHGSAHNLSRESLERFDCRRYLISTNGSGSYRHPDHQALLGILRYGPGRPCLLFNYDAETTRDWRDRKSDVLASGEFQDYDTVYPDPPEHGLVLEVG